MTEKSLVESLRQLGKYSEFEPNYFLLSADRIEELEQGVKHGKWLQTEEPLGYSNVDCVECSVCHESWVIDEDFDFDVVKMFWNFCPNCGAKMESKVTDNG